MFRAFFKYSLHGTGIQAYFDFKYSVNFFNAYLGLVVLVVDTAEPVPVFFRQSFCSNGLSNFVCVHTFYILLILLLVFPNILETLLLFNMLISTNCILFIFIE
jgi:hypothetical protein